MQQIQNKSQGNFLDIRKNYFKKLNEECKRIYLLLFV